MIRKGTMVKWNWSSGTAESKVIETYTKPITKTIKGITVTRNGEKLKPSTLHPTSRRRLCPKK